jgi:hypothetical protein
MTTLKAITLILALAVLSVLCVFRWIDHTEPPSTEVIHYIITPPDIIRDTVRIYRIIRIPAPSSHKPRELNPVIPRGFTLPDLEIVEDWRREL